MIEDYEFSKYVIDGKEYRYDIKLINKDVKIWYGRNGHNIFIKDIKDLVALNPELIVIGVGFYGRVKVKEEVINLIKSKGIELTILPTKEACNEYNKALKENKKVCAIFHGTC